MSTDAVAVPGPMELTGEERPNLTAMVRALVSQASFDETSGGTDEFVMDIMERILSAETEDEIFEAQEAGGIAGKDVAGRPFRVRLEDITWRRSNVANIDNGGLPIYALMKVIMLDTGEELVINCGGKTFVPVLFALINRNAFDKYPDGRPFVIRATPTAAGQRLSLLPYREPQSGRKAK